MIPPRHQERTRRLPRLMAAAVVMAVAAGSAFAQTPGEPPVDGTVEVLKVQGSVWMIAGAGANIAVQAGEQGVIVVDTGAGGMSDKVIAAIRSISTRPIRYIINTSMAPQHVGGNAALAVLPGGSTTGATRGASPNVIAHENVYTRMTKTRPRRQISVSRGRLAVRRLFRASAPHDLQRRSHRHHPHAERPVRRRQRRLLPRLERARDGRCLHDHEPADRESSPRRLVRGPAERGERAAGYRRSRRSDGRRDLHDPGTRPHLRRGRPGRVPGTWCTRFATA